MATANENIFPASRVAPLVTAYQQTEDEGQALELLGRIVSESRRLIEVIALHHGFVASVDLDELLSLGMRKVAHAAGQFRAGRGSLHNFLSSVIFRSFCSAATSAQRRHVRFVPFSDLASGDDDDGLLPTIVADAMRRVAPVGAPEPESERDRLADAVRALADATGWPYGKLLRAVRQVRAEPLGAWIASIEALAAEKARRKAILDAARASAVRLFRPAAPEAAEFVASIRRFKRRRGWSWPRAKRELGIAPDWQPWDVPPPNAEQIRAQIGAWLAQWASLSDSERHRLVHAASITKRDRLLVSRGPGFFGLLQRYRLACGLSVRALAARLGVSAHAMAAWLSGGLPRNLDDIEARIRADLSTITCDSTKITADGGRAPGTITAAELRAAIRRSVQLKYEFA